LKNGIEYISLGRIKKGKNEEPREDKPKFEMDILKCEGIIRSSFKFDYGYDPYELDYLHWYDFYNDLSNLSTSEFGNCCIYNRIVGILNQDASKIKETKDRANLIKEQKRLRKKYCVVDEKSNLSQEEKENVVSLYKELGLWKEA